MRYKPDIDEALGRYEAWWNGEMIGRCAVQVTAWRGGRGKAPAAPATAERQWTDIGFMMENRIYAFENIFYGGEAMPVFWPNLGPDLLTAMICEGAQIRYGEGTGTTWVSPCAKSPSELKLAFDRDNRYWKLISEMTLEASKHAKDSYIVGITDLHASLDVLAAALGAENLCLALIDEPEAIEKLQDRVFELFVEIYEAFDSIIRPYQPNGTTTTLEIWSKKRYYANVCDFIYLISTPMFDRFALPIVRRETEYFDETCFHVDGIGSLGHLDSILALEKLKSIQWVYGAGATTSKDWLGVYKRIDAAGKQIFAHGPPQDLKYILEAVPPERVLYATSCSSEDEARDYLREVEKWSFQKKIF